MEQHKDPPLEPKAGTRPSTKPDVASDPGHDQSDGRPVEGRGEGDREDTQEMKQLDE